jgi:histidinol-phosphate/aromatic aminotransferase/cobyric acid decarboxylase-like protein
MLFNGKPIEKIYVSRNAAELISKQIIVMCKHQHKKIIIDPEYKQMEVSTNKKKEILVSFEDLDSII